MDLFSLKGKVAVVTGALGLLGVQHCRALAKAGAHVVVCDLVEADCQVLAAELTTPSLGGGIDVTQPDSIIALRTKILNRWGHIDILVNNAAINDKFEDPALAAHQSQFEHYPLEMWQQSLAVNITGVFLCAQIIGAQMAKQQAGSIINIASTYGLVGPNQALYQTSDGEQPFFKSPVYPTTKGAVIAFTKYLATYWAGVGVRVNSLTPGGVENGQDDYFVRNYAARTPLKRMATPTDYQGALIFLASNASSYMTGANLIVDGGWTAW